MSAILGRHLGFGSGGVVGHLSTPEVVDLAQSADELGFDLFTLSDHLHSERESLEPWTALSWIASRTRRIEVGTNVLGLPYRDPPVLAKMAETLDQLSGGRLVLGLGAGGYDHEFDAFGLTVRTAAEKITAQYEALDILRSLWTSGASTHGGSQFRTRNARISPRATHPIPIWLGSYGPRALRLTGERADGWLPSFGRITLDQAVRMREQVVTAARNAGRDPDDVTCACNIGVRVDPHGEPRPGLITGPVDSVVEQILDVVGAGFTFLLIHSLTVDEQQVLARDVFPEVRALSEERGLVDPGTGRTS